MNFTKELAKIITEYFLPFLCVGVFVLVIVTAIRFAVARDENGRNEAKKRVVKMCSVCMIFIMLTFTMLGFESVIKKYTPPPEPPGFDMAAYLQSQNTKYALVENGGAGAVSVPINPSVTPSAGQPWLYRRPMDFDTDNDNYANYMKVMETSLTKSILPTETITSVYGWRKVFTPNDYTKYNDVGEPLDPTSKAYQIQRGNYLGATMGVGVTEGLSENNFGLDIDMGYISF